MFQRLLKGFVMWVISCYGGASEAVSARIGSAQKKFGELSVSLETGFTFEATGEDLSVLCQTSFVELL